MMKKMICLLMTILLLAGLSAPAFAAAEGKITEPGQTMPDFTVQLTDGSSATLSELLKEKDLVVLNIFATWCGPCAIEFPDMEKVYEANSDRMVILSLSADEDDTMEMVADYKESHGLTFPMGLAEDRLPFLNVTAYPTTYFITKDGTVGFLKVGAFLEEGTFEAKVNTFLAEDYDGSTLPAERAVSILPYLLICILGLILMNTVGRWLLFRKAGRPGWHSVIPFLSTYKEYALSWKGWIGILSILLLYGIMACFLLPHNNGMVLLMAALALGAFVVSLLEALKLSKAFGKGALTGVFLFLLPQIFRLILGLSGAKYRGQED